MRAITADGRTLRLGQQLGEGGEGVVLEVGGLPLIAKVVFDPADPEDLERRLATLVRRGRSPRMARLLAGRPPRVAWPVTTIRVPSSRSAAAPVHGFLMPDMRRWFQPLGCLLQPGQRAAVFPAATWATSLAAAASLARLVTDLHEADYVVGDLSPGNLWVDDQGNAGVSDVDSFQFADGSGVFPSRARTPDYTAPECLRDDNALPDALSDNFVIAVVIYQLLMQGMHPFSGIPADGSRYLSIDDNILNGRARIVCPGTVRPMRGAPPLSALPSGLQEQFVACFSQSGSADRTGRPTAADWAAALAAERGTERLRTCRVNAGHVYTVERPWCPWCEIASH
jgi:DNA-binding helix-hairpin-helix protein with protein kinase domain